MRCSRQLLPCSHKLLPQTASLQWSKATALWTTTAIGGWHKFATDGPPVLNNAASAPPAISRTFVWWATSGIQWPTITLLSGAVLPKAAATAAVLYHHLISYEICFNVIISTQLQCDFNLISTSFQA